MYTEYITLLNQNGKHNRALDCLLTNSFHPWEGGEGKAPSQYIAALCSLAVKELENDKPQAAADMLLKAFSYPKNLGEGKLYGAQENLQNYLLGVAYEKMGEAQTAREYFVKASEGLSEPQSAMYYNDQPPETIFCQGMALLKLNDINGASLRFDKLIEYADVHENDSVKIDYFAVSLPDFLVFDSDLNKQNRVHCLFMRGLGLLGKGEKEKAKACFDSAEKLDCSHTGLSLYRELFCGES